MQQITTATICTIGDEILIGQIVDTNSSVISKELNSLGIKIRYMFSIGDNRDEIITNLDRCLKETNIVIVTGGLGPTKDDITKDALKRLSGAKEYKFSEEQFAIINKILSGRGIAISDINRAQALVPDTCSVIPNTIGTAPCMKFEFEKEKYGHKAVLFSLPGVPFETVNLLPEVMKSIKKHFPLEKITHKTVLTFGIPESTLSQKIESWEDNLPDYIKLAYLPNPTLGVRLRLSCYDTENEIHTGSNENRLEVMDKEICKLKELLGSAVYGTGDESLQSILSKLLKCPPEATYQETLSVAESCTGGHLSELITSVPGCSAYYKGSVTSYSNEVKENVLGVPAEIIDKYGAVSRECVESMAKGVAEVMKTDYSIATSGIAGPGGGNLEKPVGLCWIAAVHRDRNTGEFDVVSDKIQYFSSRNINIERFASTALNLLRLLINQRLL